MGYYNDYGSYSGPQKTPYESCRELLMELRIEERKCEPDYWRVSSLRDQIKTYPISEIAKAFDSIVDECGWMPEESVIG